ncbi:MAG: hypothetical protein MJ202_05805 [Lentisphaeria bacterium]|nr:hypothetical protein [Lentisphaeria bacterium]
MPIPFLILGAAALAGAVGIGKGAKAISDNSKAKSINGTAQEILDDAKQNLKIARDSTKKSLEGLGKKKLEMCQGTLSTFVTIFSLIKNVELNDSTGVAELAKFRIDKQNFAQLKEVTMLAGSMAGGTVGGAVAGGAVAFGAYGAATAFATASTGTAIASLSGAAATNATLAFFGGGSLAAGGLGVAGGTMVLGGLVAGPALAVLGFVMGAKASANLDNAYANLAKAREAEEQVLTLIQACHGIKERADLFTNALMVLDGQLKPMVQRLSNLIQLEGVDYRSYSASAKNIVAALVSTVQAVKALLDTPLLDEKGALTAESGTVYNAVAMYVDKDEDTDAISIDDEEWSNNCL